MIWMMTLLPCNVVSISFIYYSVVLFQLISSGTDYRYTIQNTCISYLKADVSIYTSSIWCTDPFKSPCCCCCCCCCCCNVSLFRLFPLLFPLVVTAAAVIAGTGAAGGKLATCTFLNSTSTGNNFVNALARNKDEYKVKAKQNRTEQMKWC